MFTIGVGGITVNLSTNSGHATLLLLWLLGTTRNLGRQSRSFLIAARVLAEYEAKGK